MLVAHRHWPRALKYAFTRRNSSSIPPLVPIEKWGDIFKPRFKDIAKRPFLCNQRIADNVTEAFLRDTKEDGTPRESEGKVVIEAYPGAGALSRSLLSLPPSRLKKLIVLEENPAFYDTLKALEDADPRVTFIPQSGFFWSTYTELEARGLLDDVKRTPWESDEQPNLHFISHLPNTVHGDQLLAQIFRCMPDQSWLFKYGRVPLGLLMTQTVWDRTSAGVKKSARCKLSVIAEAVANCSEAYPAKQLKFHENFYPPVELDEDEKPKKRKNASPRRSGASYVAVNVDPKANSFVKSGQLDKWDFILRKLFVLKASPLGKGVPSIAPGAGSIMKILNENLVPGGELINPAKEIRDLTVEEWAVVVDAFDAWPFAPEDLMITDGFFRDIEKKT